MAAALGADLQDRHRELREKPRHPPHAMKIAVPQLLPRRRKAGFTMLELSTAMCLLIVLGTALVTMLNQHMTFVKMFRQQSFLASEAPQIGNLLGRILNAADHYFVYSSK